MIQEKLVMDIQAGATSVIEAPACYFSYRYTSILALPLYPPSA